MVRLTATVAALALCAGAVAQDEKKPDESKQLRADVAKALRETAKAGAFDVAGESKVEQDGEGMVVGDGGWGGLSGKITGSVAFPLKAAFRLQAGKTRYELWSSGGKTVERVTWRGRPAYAADAANELLSLVNFEKLAADVEKASQGKAREAQKVGDDECRVIELTLAGDAIRKHVEEDDPEDAPEGMEFDMGLKASSVTLKAWIGKDGTVRKIEAAVVKKLDMDGEGGEDDEEAPEGMSYQITAAYTLTFSNAGRAKVEIPEDVREQLKEKE